MEYDINNVHIEINGHIIKGYSLGAEVVCIPQYDEVRTIYVQMEED